MWLHLDVRTVGDMGKLPDSLPVFLLPDVPLNFDTLSIILPYSAGLAVVGLLESMMTATIVDDMTDTPSDKTGSVRLKGLPTLALHLLAVWRMRDDRPVGDQREIRGGVGVSALSAGVVLLCMVVFLRDWVSQIPMAALVAVMIMVSIGTFSWRSITNLRSHPLSTSVVMLATVVVVVATHNLAYGVLTGVLIASLNFASKVSRFMAVSSELKASTRTYAVTGQVFFASPIGL